jgi:predicted phage terminase large subunit-like protein
MSMTKQPSLPSQAEAAQELLNRIRSRRSLIDFAQYTFPQYEPAEHHRLIAEKLEAIERGEIQRLMIFMPPRHGKSELATKRFPAWFLGRNPHRQIIQASYNGDLATDFGRQVRNIFQEHRFRNVFGAVDLAQDSKAANRWNTNKGGAYVAAGVGTAVTGRGADILIIDDPLKDREEAESETRRETVWNWYTSTAYTRLQGMRAEILVQTRWHEDDLAGRLLEAEAKGGKKWEKLILPAIMSDGGALWPDQFPINVLHEIKQTIGPRDWSALYQQEPSPDEGTFFKREWFERHTKIDEPHHFYLASDYAVTDGGGDYTEHGVFAIGASGKIYHADWWSGQTSSDVWIDELLRLIKKWKPICAFGEAGVIQKAIEPMLRRRMIETGTRCRMEWLSSIHDKATRARGFQSRAAMGEVSLRDDDDGERILNQLLKFPAGKHDDAVDVCGLIGRALDMAHPAIVPIEKPKAKTFTDYRGASDGGGDSWRV